MNDQQIYVNQAVSDFSRACSSEAANTRELLRHSAKMLFSAHGFHAVGMRKLAAAAGLHAGSIYAFFESKHEILADLIEEFEDNLLMAVQGEVGAASGDHELDAYVESSVKFLVANGESETLAQHDFRALPPVFREPILCIRHSRRELLIRILAKTGSLQPADFNLVADGVESLISGAAKSFSSNSSQPLDGLTVGVGRLAWRLISLPSRSNCPSIAR